MTYKALRLLILWLVNSPLRGTHAFRLKAHLMRLAGYEVGFGTKIVGPIQISPTCGLKLGEDTWVGANLTIHGNGAVQIGDRCDLAPDVTFLTGSHELGDSSRRAGRGRNTCVIVGDACWLGARCTLVGDLEVGESAVIGAGSLVINNVDESSLWAGVPAKRIRRLP